jgi:hypothetical protein
MRSFQMGFELKRRRAADDDASHQYMMPLGKMVRSGPSRAVDRSHLLAFQILVRLSSDTRHGGEWLEHLRFVPRRDLSGCNKVHPAMKLFDHLVDSGEQRRRHCDAKLPRGPDIEVRFQRKIPANGHAT